MGAIISGEQGVKKGQVARQSGWIGVDVSPIGTNPPELSENVGSSPASTTYGDEGCILQTGDAAGEHATLYTVSNANMSDADIMLIGVLGFQRTAIGDANTDYFLVGFIDVTGATSDDDNIACFAPEIGDDTDRNITVDNGSRAEGSISYPTLTEPHYYEVVVDFSNSETRFYVDGSELRDDPTTGVISEIPDISKTTFGDRAFGVGVNGDNQSSFHVLHFRMLGKVI